MSGKLCPILSVATLTKEPSRIVTPGVSPESRQEPAAMGCVGDKCAWWIGQTDDKGNVVGGGCAMATLPVVTMNAASAQTGFAHMLGEMMRQLRIKPPR